MSVAPGAIVAGNIVIDTLVRPVGAIEWGTTRWVDDLDQHLGGNGASTAFALAKFGVPVRLLGWVGCDSLAEIAIAALTSAGVDLAYVNRGTGVTAASVSLVDSTGQRALLHRRGVSLDAFPEPVDFTPHLTNGAKHFHIANPFSTVGMRRHASESLRRAKQHGLTTSLDTGWDSRGEWRTVLDPCLPFVDVLFVNETEAAALEGDGTALNAPAVIRKLASRGCSVNGELMPGFAIDAVDTTGAGDCFAGGFLAARLRGASLTEAAKFANVAGALSASRLGAVTGLLDYKATLAWMRSK